MPWYIHTSTSYIQARRRAICSSRRAEEVRTWQTLAKCLHAKSLSVRAQTATAASYTPCAVIEQSIVDAERAVGAWRRRDLPVRCKRPLSRTRWRSGARSKVFRIRSNRWSLFPCHCLHMASRWLLSCMIGRTSLCRRGLDCRGIDHGLCVVVVLLVFKPE